MSDWARQAERGTMGALRLGARLYRLLGRRLLRLLLGPITLYFALVDRGACRASREYLTALHESAEGPERLGAPPGTWQTLRHLFEFATQLLDRMVLWSGERDAVAIEYAGDEHLRRLVGEGRGALFLGAHVGSYDMMRFLAGSHGVPVNVLMFTRNAERINAFFRELDPTSAVRVLPVKPDSVRTAFDIRACLERGEFVGILGDRTGLFPGAGVHRTRFLGREAAFPKRPFSLAAVLGCPVLLATCLRVGEARYRVEVTPLVPLDEVGRVPREEREKRTAELAEAFVGHLERTCRQAPDQWFNFYPFFDQGGRA